jgi:urease accessory protein
LSEKRSSAGSGTIRVSRVNGRSVLTRARAFSPLKLLNPRHGGSSAWTYVATYGGGLVAGDALSIDIDVDAEAAALVATQASTKVYRSGQSRQGTTQTLRARLARDSLLVVLPDPVTAFAGSRYQQDQFLDLAPTASLVLLDWFTSGRAGSGERWQFDTYASRTRLYRDGRLIWHDAVTLAGAGSIARRMGRFDCVALAALSGPLVRSAATRLLGVMASAPAPARADVLLSAAPIADDGVLVRVAGRSAEQVGATLRQHLAFVPALLGDDPWACRW